MTEPHALADLGPLGTYTHEAARAFAARLGIADPEFIECSSFDEVFDCVDRGKCEYGVVGIENSLEGSVTATLDNFAFNSSANILGEEVLDIHHSLILHPEAKLEDVTTIASHHQGLAQCRRYIAERLPGRDTITTSSTAESARLAASNKHIAGIANAFAAELYGAIVFDDQIEDHFGNQTSFALIARQGHPSVFEGDRHKTFLALFMQIDRAGTLSMILSEFALCGHQPHDDPIAPHQAGARRLHVLREFRALGERSPGADRAQLPAPQAARSEGARQLPDRLAPAATGRSRPSHRSGHPAAQKTERMFHMKHPFCFYRATPSPQARRERAAATTESPDARAGS